MNHPKKKATAVGKVKFKDLGSKKNPRGGDESPKEMLKISSFQTPRVSSFQFLK